MERLPRVVVNLRFQRRLERFVRIVRAEEIGVTHKKTLRIVIGVNEPAGDAVRAVAPNLARVGMKNINTVDQNLCPVASGQCQWEVRVGQVLERSERLRPLSIRPMSPARASKGLICSALAIPNRCARIRNVSVSAREPLAIPRNWRNSPVR